MQWILLILGVILAVVAVFALQNPAVVNLRFLNLSGEASVLVVILIAYAAGVFSGVLALIPSSVRKTARLRKLRSEMKTLEKQTAAEPEQAKPSKRRFREVEAESTRTPAPIPASPAKSPVVQPAPAQPPVAEAPAAEAPVAEAPAVPAPVSLVPSTESAEGVSVDDRPENAGATDVAAAMGADVSAETDPSPEGESPVEGGGSGAEPSPDLDAEPPAGARRGIRRFWDF
ncbi:MAG: LapA family protein [Actinobacteria bacterium]|nr:LapA family protein [Actinomycetota bacterium]